MSYYDILLITGNCQPKTFVEEVKRYSSNVKTLAIQRSSQFYHRRHFSHQKEYEKLGEYKLILTTEKDYVRLKGFDYLRKKLYYLD